MKKHAYRIATTLQDQLMGAGMIHPADEWARHVPRVQLDAWASLWRWNQAGEPLLRLSEGIEGELLESPPEPALPLATVALRHEALACQMPDRRQWIIVARHVPAPAWIPVHSEIAWQYAQPTLTYCGSSAEGTETGMISGVVNLLDQPTVASLNLRAGKIAAASTGESRALSPVDILSDDYRFSLALAALLTRFRA